MNPTFKHIVGQDHIKRQLSFYLDAYKTTNILPFLMFNGQRGIGKTEFARALGGAAKKTFYEINSSSIKSEKQFFEQMMPQIQGTECILFFDEAHELPKKLVTAFDCPHLLGKHIEHLKDEHGEQSLIYRSQVLAEFTSLDEAAFISSTLFENYPNIPPRTFGLPNRAGIDLSLGGDETVAYFFVNGKLHLRTTKLRNEATLHNQIISWIKEFNVTPSEVRIDDGGLGRPIVQRVQNAGYDVVPVRTKFSSARSMFPNTAA